MDIDPASYGMILRNAFTKQYGEATDEWTNDLQMRPFASFVHERLRLSRATRVLDVRMRIRERCRILVGHLRMGLLGSTSSLMEPGLIYRNTRVTCG